MVHLDKRRIRLSRRALVRRNRSLVPGLMSDFLFVLTLLLSNVQDCGYVFTRGPKAWAALPADYSCPPCGSAKHRFKKVPKGSAK